MRVSFEHFLLFLSLLSSVYSRKFEYLNSHHEGDNCVLRENPRQLGKCIITIACPNEYERFRHNETVLKICKYGKRTEENIICCPQQNLIESEVKFKHPELIFSTQNKNSINRPDLSYETCRDRYLQYRKNFTSVNDLFNILFGKKRNVTDEYCNIINKYGSESLNHEIDPVFRCIDGNVGAVLPYHGYIARLGDWQDMAALGWTQNDGKIEYKCGGVIISDKFIITAAHCRYKGKNPDTIRVGDRYLDTTEDDIYSQQLTVEKFIPHPDYKSIEVYNDIAVIKTIEKIFFNEFVAPACIADEVDYKKIDYSNPLQLFIAGYGQTETMEVSNVLIEINIKHVSNENCSQAYEDDPRVPRGILPSQVCVIGKSFDGIKIPDSCFGDSGGPLQFKGRHEIRHDDYDRTLLKTIYEIPTVIGLVSFGSSCGLGIPSVNTKISFYREWIESVMQN